MTRRLPRFPIAAAALVCAALLLPAAASAADPEGTVSGIGMSAIEKPADTLRMQLPLEVEGATLKEALDKLKTRRAEIKAGLLKLGAVEKSIDTGDAVASDGNSPLDRRAAMERAMRERMGNGAGAPATQAAKKITVSCVIKADWALKPDAAEQVIVQASDIQDKIKAAKLTDAPKTPAAAEAAEEAAMMAGNESGRSPNDPAFYYIARVTDAENAKATAEAFAKAKEAAGKLAKAAGMDLGTLHTLAGQLNADSEDAMTQDPENAYYRQQMMSRYGGQDVKEGYSPQPGKVTIQVMVQASFTLK